MTTPWTVRESVADPGTMEVRGAYLVADLLPIEDARLIAAAPDMYEALKALVDADGSTDIAAAMDAAEAALAKASGDR